MLVDGISHMLFCSLLKGQPQLSECTGETPELVFSFLWVTDRLPICQFYLHLRSKWLMATRCQVLWVLCKSPNPVVVLKALIGCSINSKNNSDGISSHWNSVFSHLEVFFKDFFLCGPLLMSLLNLLNIISILYVLGFLVTSLEGS